MIEDDVGMAKSPSDRLLLHVAGLAKSLVYLVVRIERSQLGIETRVFLHKLIVVLLQELLSFLPWLLRWCSCVLRVTLSMTPALTQAVVGAVRRVRLTPQFGY